MQQDSQHGKFFYGIINNTCVIKAVGNITYRISGSFDSFINTIVSDNSINDFLIDLTETEYIDSTNLGLLARIQMFSVNKFGRKPALISTNESINNILNNLGFKRLFNVLYVEQAGTDGMKELPSAIKNQRPMQDILLSAHRYLTDSDVKNAMKFKEIVDLFEKDKKAGNAPN